MTDPIADAIVPQPTDEQAATAALPSRPTMSVVAALSTNDTGRGDKIGAAELGALAGSLIHQGGPTVAATVVAALPGYERAENVRMLSHSQGTFGNTELIREALDARGNKAATAALCDPLEIIRDVPNCGVEDRPFRSIFTRIPMARGGFTYTPGVDVQATVWTEADQAAVDPTDSATWKPCTALACSPAETVKASEAVGCITFDDTLEWSNPELVSQAWGRALVNMARASEVKLLSDFDALALAAGGAFTSTALAGFSMQGAVKEAVAEALNAALYDVRETGAEYVIALPYGLARLIAANEAAQTNNGCVAEADVLACIADATGRETVSVLDATGVAADPIPAALNPGSPSALSSAARIARIRLVPASAMFVGETGVEEYGVERSPELRKQNKAQMFGREYFALGRPGCAVPAYVDIADLCVRGGRLGTVTPGC